MKKIEFKKEKYKVLEEYQYLSIELCDMFRKETHDKYGICFSSNDRLILKSPKDKESLKNLEKEL